MGEKKYEHLIVKRPVPVSSLPHHENEPAVEYPVLMSKSLVPEADVWVTQLFASCIPEILAAFSTAARVTIAGSTIPALTRSSYSPVRALKP